MNQKNAIINKTTYSCYISRNYAFIEKEHPVLIQHGQCDEEKGEYNY